MGINGLPLEAAKKPLASAGRSLATTLIRWRPYWDTTPFAVRDLRASALESTRFFN